MVLLVFADSHGRTLNMYSAIEALQPDAVIHLGDYFEDACDLRRSYPDFPVYAVRGNNDFEPDAPDFLVIAPEGVRIYLAHGHRERVRRLDTGRMAEYAENHGCQLALFGHTHLRLDEQQGSVRVFNPGSISLPRDGYPSFLKLTVQDGKLLEVCFFNANNL